jgi:ParB family chromosome partitioning protein
VQQNGVVQPVLLRRTSVGLRLIAGGRRLHAARAAGLDAVPAIVRELDDERTVVDGLLEKLHREDLDPIAQALAYADALDALGVTKQALANGLGISRPQLSNTIRLLGLPGHLRDHVASGALTAEQGRALLAVGSDPNAQDALVDRLLVDRAARRGTARERTPLDDQLAEIAQLLTGLLDTKVRIRAKGDSTEITIVVGQDERARVLEQLGVAA